MPIVPGPANKVAFAVANYGFVGDWTNPGYASHFNLGLNNPLSIPHESSMPMYSNTNDAQTDYLGAMALVKYDDVDFNFNKNVISIKNLNIKIGADVLDKANIYSTIKISILDATDAKDESDAKVLTTIQAFVHQGKLIINGDIELPAFEQMTGKNIYTCNTASLDIKMNKNIKLENLILDISSDQGSLAEGITPRFEMELPKNSSNSLGLFEQSNIELDILGNVVSNNMRFKVKNNVPDLYKNAKVYILNNEGKVVRNISNNKFSTLQQVINTDVSSLASGNYYLILETNKGDRFTRKFIKQ